MITSRALWTDTVYLYLQHVSYTYNVYCRISSSAKLLSISQVLKPIALSFFLASANETQSATFRIGIEPSKQFSCGHLKSVSHSSRGFIGTHAHIIVGQDASP